MEATGTFHISRTRLDGPAERTLVQPWLTELTHEALNTYAEPPRALATVETLPVKEHQPAREARRRRTRVAAAA